MPFCNKLVLNMESQKLICFPLIENQAGTLNSQHLFNYYVVILCYSL